MIGLWAQCDCQTSNRTLEISVSPVRALLVRSVTMRAYVTQGPSNPSGFSSSTHTLVTWPQHSTARQSSKVKSAPATAQQRYTRSCQHAAAMVAAPPLQHAHMCRHQALTSSSAASGEAYRRRRFLGPQRGTTVHVSNWKYTLLHVGEADTLSTALCWQQRPWASN
jgi:hypothetical protein